MAKNIFLFKNIEKLIKANKKEKILLFETITYFAAQKEISLEDASSLIKMLE